MKLHQLSLFLENRPGTIKVPCKILADAGINMLALTLADTQSFGILRLIVKDWQKAQQVLSEAGCVVKVTEVVAIDVPDEPGGLLRILDVLETSNQAIEYMYAFTTSARGHKAALIFRFEDPDGAIKSLAANGINSVAPAELFARFNA